MRAPILRLFFTCCPLESPPPTHPLCSVFLPSPQARTLGLPADTPLVLVVTSDASAAVPVQQRSPLEQSRAAALGGPEDAAAASYPAPKHVGDLVRFTTMPSDHRNYALIWATLCVVLAAMGRTAVTKPLRGPRIVDYQADARAAWGKSHNAQ